MSVTMRSLRIGLCTLALGLGVEAQAATQPPSAQQAEGRAVLTVSGFTIDGSVGQQGYSYIPKLTLNEVGGKASARAVRMVFKLLDVGATGNVPPTPMNKRVPAGGSLPVFHELVYGDPELEITSRAKADRVSVVVTYVDEDGTTYDVSAITNVTWR